MLWFFYRISMSATQLITISATNYPNSILLGNKPYDLNFQLINNSGKPKQFRFEFTMEGISGNIPKNFQKPVTLDPSKPYDLLVQITPTVNGSAKLIIQANAYEEVQYKELVWNVRKELSQKRRKTALGNSFVKFKDLTKGNRKLPKFKNGKVLDTESAAQEYEKIHSSSMSQIEKDQQLPDVAKRVFYTDMNFAFEILKMVQNQASVQDLLADFIYAAIDNNKDLSVSTLPAIQHIKTKDNLLVKMACYVLEKDLSLAIQLCYQINNLETRDSLLRDIFYFSYLKQFDEAMQLISNVSDQHLQLGLYYEMIKIMVKGDPSKCDALLKNLIQKSIINQEIEILTSLLLISAHLHNPQTAVDTINTLPPELKESVNKQVFKALWEQVEEIKIRVDEVPVTSLYFAFNVMAKPSSVISKVADLGGTVSENLINGEMNSVIGIVNLFSFNFPVYPTIEQCYNEIKTEKGKSFYYLIIPLKKADDATYEMAQTIIKNLFVDHANKVAHKMYIFNLDFIPYMAKPTIIVGDDPEENIVISSIVKRAFKNDVTLIIDDGLFKEGKINEWIKSILPSNKFKLLNLVLTYDFLNDYNLFKKFMIEFVR